MYYQIPSLNNADLNWFDYLIFSDLLLEKKILAEHS